MASGKFMKKIKEKLAHISIRACLLGAAKKIGIAMIVAFLLALIGVALVYGGLEPIPFFVVFGVLTAVISSFFLLLWLIAKLPGVLASFCNTLLSLLLVSGIVALVIDAVIFPLRI